MSQAVIDFCEGLKTTLLGLERQLGAAKRALDSGASQVESEARKHVDEAAEQLQTFKTHAGLMAQAIRADLPEHSAAIREKLKDFGAEAQVAMRHAVVFLAESTAKGAEGAATAWKQGADRAQGLAEDLRRDTAVTVVEPSTPKPGTD